MLFALRMCLMGLHFILAGVLGVILGVCRPFNPDNSRLCARLYALPAMWFLRLRVKAEVDTLVNKTQGCVIIANHQSNYDLFVFGNVVPRRTVCIGKKSLKWIPFFGQLYWLAGNVLIERGNAVQELRARIDTHTKEIAEHVMLLDLARGVDPPTSRIDPSLIERANSSGMMIRSNTLTHRSTTRENYCDGQHNNQTTNGISTVHTHWLTPFFSGQNVMA